MKLSSKVKRRKERLNKVIDVLGFEACERLSELSGSTLGQYASQNSDKSIPELKLKYLESLCDGQTV